MNGWLERLVELESEIEYKTPPATGEAEFVYTAGQRPVLLSAPHGAAHTRNGRLKEEDDYTAGIARLVAEITGAHVIYSWRKSATDPNYVAEVPYKQALRAIAARQRIGFVLDIHGCAAYRDFGIGLGTMRGQSCPDHYRLILRTFSRAGYHPGGPWLSRLDVDRTFTAGDGQRQETITRFAAQQLRLPTAQIELNAYLRVVRRFPDASDREPFQGDPQHILHAIRALCRLVQALAG